MKYVNGIGYTEVKHEKILKGFIWLKVVQSLSRVQLFVTLWTAAHWASMSFTISQGLFKLMSTGASQRSLVVKNLLANAGDIRDMGSIPGCGKSPGKGNGNPLHYS